MDCGMGIHEGCSQDGMNVSRLNNGEFHHWHPETELIEAVEMLSK